MLQPEPTSFVDCCELKSLLKRLEDNFEWSFSKDLTCHCEMDVVISGYSSEDINFKKNTTLLSFANMFRRLLLPSSV